MTAAGSRCAATQPGDPLEWSPQRWQSGSDAEPSVAAPRALSRSAPPAAPLTPPAVEPGQLWIDRNPDPDPGATPLVLRDHTGAVQRYVEPTAAIELDALLGAVARVRHDTGKTLLATQLDIDPAPLAAQRAPRSAVAAAQYQTDDPTQPIVREELPPGNPSPPPTGVAGPSLGQPDFVQPDLGAQAYEPAIDSLHAPVSCGDACPPYGYSSSPSYLADSLGELLRLGWLAPPHWLAPPRANGPAIDFGGWTQIGYHTDQTPLSTTRGDLRAFNDVPSGIRLQQQWLWIAREADGRHGPDWGFRFDVMYGTDAQKTQAFGNPGAGTPGFGTWDASLDHGIYGWAMPQFYGELAADEWSVVFGRFFTPVGYEVVTAPDNFFYSHSLTMFNSEPFTHTGVLATYQPYSHPADLEVYAGYTLGWDTAFEQTNDGSTFVGGFSFRPHSSVTLAYLATAGNLGARSGGGSGYTHSIVADVAVTPRLTYVLQSDFVDYDDQTGTGLGDDQVGVNNYLLYALGRCWGVGARAEWWKSDGASFYETTLGLNYRPAAGLVLRPEVRWDRAPGRDETSLAIDAILVY